MSSGRLGYLNDQVELARSEQISSKLENHLKEDSPMSDRIRSFHNSFLAYAVNKNMRLDWWKEIFANDKYKYISYYRKDSYLLADAPFIFKPTMAIINDNISTDYYGVDHEGIRLLVENKATWLEASHPKKYSNRGNGCAFIEKMSETKHTPLYCDVFEDALAVYWIRQIMSGDDTGLSGDIIRKFSDYTKYKNKYSFDDFLITYLEYHRNSEKELNKKLANLIDKIPEGPVDHDNASLNYKNLKSAAMERLLKIKLFQDCVDTMGTKEIVMDFTETVNELERLMRYQQLTHLKRNIAYFIFKFWQVHGSPWFYSSGNIVDFSGRDLCLEQCGKVNDPTYETETILIPIYSKVETLINNTDIDDIQSVEQLGKQRLYRLNNFFSQIKESSIGTKENAFQNLCYDISEITHKDKDIPRFTKELEEILKDILRPRESFAKAAITELASLIPIKGPSIGSVSLLSKKLKIINKYGLMDFTKANSFNETEFHRIVQSNVLKHNSDQSHSYLMHALQLPYYRSKSKVHSRKSIYNLGGDADGI